MKFILLPFMILFVHAVASAQSSNTRAGNWSDPTLWSNNLVPNGADSVTLQFDVVIDESAACKFLHSNGHQVTVKTGVDFAVGKPLAVRDTATLLTITTTSVYYGEPADSVHRVLKNSYVNGLKRIIGMQNQGTPYMAYTVFTYNSQNQLISLLKYNHEGFNEVFRTSIFRTNDRISKLETVRGGQLQSVQTISYVANGANTDVVVNRVDTALTVAGNIALINTQKNVLTVSPSFNPISKNLYEYKFYPVGPEESFDTTNSTYQYDAHGNLSELWESSHRTQIQSNGFAYRTIDSTTRSFVRNNPDSASVYRFLLDVYGNELLTLIDYGLLPLEIRDVTGYVYPPLNGHGQYREQTVSSMIFSSKEYSNGHFEGDFGPVQQYRAVNQFDDRQRLLSSIIDYGGNDPFIITMRMVYPD